MLPKIDIPVNLPFDVPHLLHPPIVHFAVVIPVLIVLLEVINLFVKKRGLSILNTSLLVVLIFIFFAAFFTGKADGSNAFDLLSSNGKELLKEHKLLGTYLVYGSIILLLLKLLTFTKVSILKVLYMLALFGFTALVFHQGEEGGKLVFVQGANIKAVSDINEKLSDMQDDMDDLKDELSSLKEKEDSQKMNANKTKSETSKDLNSSNE